VAGGQSDELEPFGGASSQFAVRMRHEHGPLSALAEAEHSQQHLILSAAPGGRRIDVQREH